MAQAGALCLADSQKSAIDADVTSTEVQRVQFTDPPIGVNPGVATPDSRRGEIGGLVRLLGPLQVEPVESALDLSYKESPVALGCAGRKA